MRETPGGQGGGAKGVKVVLISCGTPGQRGGTSTQRCCYVQYTPPPPLSHSMCSLSIHQCCNPLLHTHKKHPLPTTQVLEYSELDPATASAVDPSTGKLFYNWSNICMHYFSVPWLTAAAAHLRTAAVYHIAHKQIPSKGGVKVPGLKLEMFIFDPFDTADNTTLYEVGAWVWVVCGCEQGWGWQRQGKEEREGGDRGRERELSGRKCAVRCSMFSRLQVVCCAPP